MSAVPDIPRTLDDLRAAVHSEVDPRIQLCLRWHGEQVILDLIQVVYPLRGRGLARAALTLLCELTDRAGWELSLQPSPALGSDPARLAAWYHEHGFRFDGPPLPLGQLGWMTRPVRILIDA